MAESEGDSSFFMPFPFTSRIFCPFLMSLEENSSFWIKIIRISRIYGNYFQIVRLEVIKARKKDEHLKNRPKITA
ncbi:MAG: hypothetical protein K6B75_08835 [Lachnospiraceae bacterium]|nr:hypothetical protein [Lachnospiraceae bacterium]